MLQVTVDEDVPLAAPDRPRRPRARAEDVKDGTVDVEVLANDEDPDGTVDELAVDGRGRRGTGALGRHRAHHARRRGAPAPLHDHRPRRARGIRVHPRAVARRRCAPTLISTEGIEVQERRDGRDPARRPRARVGAASPCVITEAAKVAAVHSDGANLVKDQTTLVYTSARRLLRAGRDHVRGHRRNRPRRPGGPQGDAHAAGDGAAARQPAADASPPVR